MSHLLLYCQLFRHSVTLNTSLTQPVNQRIGQKRAQPTQRPRLGPEAPKRGRVESERERFERENHEKVMIAVEWVSRTRMTVQAALNSFFISDDTLFLENCVRFAREYRLKLDISKSSKNDLIRQ